MNRKTIGIPGWSLGENSFGVTKPYMEYLSRFGDVVILPPMNGIIKDLDLLVLPGGTDTSSYRYGAVPSFRNSNPDLYKEFFLDNNLGQYVEARTPIFGICLGLQMLNVYFGGELTQNVGHPYSDADDRTEEVHEVKFIGQRGASIKKAIGLTKNEFKVNSLHHQGVKAYQLAAGLCPVLISDLHYTPQESDHHLVEGFIHEALPIGAVQWHPEEIYDNFSEYLIEKILMRKEAKSDKKDQQESVTDRL